MWCALIKNLVRLRAFSFHVARVVALFTCVCAVAFWLYLEVSPVRICWGAWANVSEFETGITEHLCQYSMLSLLLHSVDSARGFQIDTPSGHLDMVYKFMKQQCFSLCLRHPFDDLSPQKV